MHTGVHRECTHCPLLTRVQCSPRVFSNTHKHCGDAGELQLQHVCASCKRHLLQVGNHHGFFRTHFEGLWFLCFLPSYLVILVRSPGRNPNQAHMSIAHIPSPKAFAAFVSTLLTVGILVKCQGAADRVEVREAKQENN